MRTNNEFSTAVAVAPPSTPEPLPPESRDISQGSRQGSFVPSATKLVTETIFASLSYILAVLIVHRVGTRSQFLWPPTVLIVLGIRFLSLYWLGPYKGSLRHAGLHELLSLVKAVCLGSLLLVPFLRLPGLSGESPNVSLFVVDWALCLLLLSGLHFGTRIYRLQQTLWQKRGKRVAVIGAGDAGMSLVRELASDSNSKCRPVAIFDDNPRTHGTTICGIPVVGSTEHLALAAKSKNIDEVFICIPSATRSEMSRLFNICCHSGLPVRTLPTLTEIVDGRVSQRDLRTPRIEDLLQREELLAEPGEIAEIAGGRVVLITGAGGSIGSELCRQIAGAGPRKLLLLERTENSLFYIDRELRDRFPELSVEPLLVDVTLKDRVRQVFEQHGPSLVLHAAAHKHVGLLELHPSEAIRNNVIGTRNVALAALEYGAERFVNISTDKAVNPENYMGLSKKLTELCIQNLATRRSTRFMSVRFGNVAGSTGSVLRLFSDHIEKGEPLHVTDPRATRFFMSIPEAVHLILRAAGQGNDGETFVLEMGEPINIYELAKSMSLLAGFAPGKELPIHFVGLRDGEKVSEELWSPWEHPTPSAHKGILVIEQKDPLAANILQSIDELELDLLSNRLASLDNRLRELFPSFAAKHPSPFVPAKNEPRVERVSSDDQKKNIPLSKPDISDLEIRNVLEVLKSSRLSLGPRLAEFETKFAAYVGTRYAIATNSGTSALHLAIRAMGIGPEDEVITSPFSFVASTNCILYEGARPVFLDIDPATKNIDPKQLHSFLHRCCEMDTDRGVLVNKASGRIVKAILPVHVFGLPCEMGPILELAQQYGLRILEDSCEALGANYRGQRVGTFGDAGVFAFYPNKQMTTGEGGMIVTDDQGIAKVCRSLRNQGRDDASSWLRHIRLGYNYRLSELHCALGLAQLERLDELLRARDRVAAGYDRALSSIPHLVLPKSFNGVRRSWFVYVVEICLPQPRAIRDRIILQLRERGVESQAYFPAIHTQPYLGGKVSSPLGCLTNTESASERCLALPFFPSMTAQDIHHVSETLRQLLGAEMGSQAPACVGAALTQRYLH